MIALTAGVTEAERDAITASGMTDLLAKPVTLETLRATLGRWVQPPGTGTEETVATLPLVAPAGRDGQAAGDAEAPEAPLSIPGFDLRTLMQTLGDRSCLIDLLHRFAETIQGDAQAIARALASGDSTQAARQIHRLKGTAGNLGAIDLQAAAQRLETDLQAGCDPASALAALTEAHALVLSRIAGLPPAVSAAPATGAGDPEAVPGCAAAIAELLARGLLVPPDLLAALQAALPAADRALYQTLKGHLARFDYPAANRVLTPLLTRSPPRSPPGARS